MNKSIEFQFKRIELFHLLYALQFNQTNFNKQTKLSVVAFPLVQILLVNSSFPNLCIRHIFQIFFKCNELNPT